MIKAGRDPSQTHIPDFFEGITEVIKNDEETKKIITSIYGNEENSSDSCIAPILKKLYENVKKNALKKSNYGNRHDATTKNFAASLYCLIGESGYEMLVTNLGCGLPSVSSVQQMIAKKKKITEREFLFDDLLRHLEEFDAPLAINIHLDDTRIVHKVEYDQVNDLLVFAFR